MDTTGIRYIDGRRMQCKDIPDELFLHCVRSASVRWGTATRADLAELLEARVGPVPWNLLSAKARNLIARKRLDGCACGCSGSFSVVEPGTTRRMPPPYPG